MESHYIAWHSWMCCCFTWSFVCEFKTCPCFSVAGHKIIVFQHLALSLGHYSSSLGSVSVCEGSTGQGKMMYEIQVAVQPKGE